MKVMVCGSIGMKNTIKQINTLYAFLQENGFEILDHLKFKDMDYSKIKDFSNNPKLCKKIVHHDLDFVTKSDVVVVLIDNPSFGTAIELFLAYQQNKLVILYGKKSVASPWPLFFSHKLAENQAQLLGILTKYKKRF